MVLSGQLWFERIVDVDSGDLLARYVRVKRKNQTIFLHVEPSDVFSSIKARCADICGLSPGAVALYLDQDKNRELVDMASVSDLEIKNDDIIYMVFKKEGSDASEEVEIEPFEPLGDEGKA